MNEKILQANSFCEGLEQVCEQIRARTVSLEAKHVLIVPDNYTLSAETMLFEGTFGAFDVEVLSFSRLFFRLSERQESYLDARGAVMMIRSICNNLQLDCYKKSAHHAGFAKEVYDTFLELGNRGIDILQANAAKPSASAKLSDLKAIYLEYKRRTEGKFVDSAGRLELLADAILTTDLSKTHFYIANFMDYTAGEARVIAALKKRAASLTCTKITMDEPPITAKSIEVYDCAGSANALKAAARRIRSAVMQGMRYKDICIATSELTFTEAERIFSEYEIPFYTDHAYSLIEHPLAEYLLVLIEIITKKYRRRDMISLAKNAFSGIDKQDSDAFENICKEFNIDYVAFLEPFVAERFGCEDVRALAAAERVRSALLSRVMSLESAYKKTGSAAQFAAFARKALSTAARDQEVGKVDIHTNDAEQKIQEVLSLMEAVLFDSQERTELLTDIFVDGLNKGRIEAIPNLSDSVVVGTPTTFRGGKFKFVLILGANEGVIPAPKAGTGLFARDEEAIEGYSKGSKNDNVIELNHLLSAATNRIFVSYESALEGGMSSYFKVLLPSLAKRVSTTLERQEAQSLIFAPSDQLVREFCCSRAAATELFIANMSAYKVFGQIADYNASLYAALKDYGADRYIDGRQEQSFIGSSDLFCFGDVVSVSRLQEYCSCPYSHFLKYVLRAKKNKDGEFLPMDIGTLLHSCVELFAADRSGWNDVAATCTAILQQILADNPRLKHKLKKRMYDLLLNESIEICTILKSHFELGDFESLGQEIRLESAAHLKPLVFCVDGVKTKLVGSVDYADVYKGRVRIIDYKTGNAKFSYSDIYYGKKLQLPLYMQAYIASGYKAAGFFYFPFRRKWNDDERSHRFKGVFLSDMDNVLAMDKSIDSGGLSNVIYAKTTLKEGEPKLFGRHDYALSDEQLNTLCSYAQECAKQAITEIQQGYIAKSPYKQGKSCACDYCDYTTICGKIGTKERTLSSCASPLKTGAQQNSEEPV